MREASRSLLGSEPQCLQADAKDDKMMDDRQSKEKFSSKQSTDLSSKVRKPAWAINEQTALLQSEQKEKEEEDELLDFAQSLDYEKFISDMEVRVMVEKLRDRIVLLENDVETENEREIDAETRAARREMLALMNDAESALLMVEREKDFNRNKADNAAMNAAKALLDEGEIQAVHSAKSVVQLLQNAKEKIRSVQQASRPLGTPAEPKVQNEVSVLIFCFCTVILIGLSNPQPKVVIHDPNEGARLEEKKNVNKLPYMHRNPAI
jgi:hypothetical protein